MKLIRFGENGKEKPGVILNDKKYDVSAFGEDYTEQFFETDGVTRLAAFIKDKQLPEVADSVRLGSPIVRPSKIVCIGLNYADHAKETNAPLDRKSVV